LKRGLVTWDKTELVPAVLEQRLERVRRFLSDQQLPALVVYSELWRSNQGRFFSNYMPYFNRALLIIPLVAPPTLLCGLSPRVYGWIKSVTIIEDVRPAGNFAGPLFQLTSERGWNRVGILDAKQLPYDLYQAIHSGALEVADISSDAIYLPAEDEAELAMRRKALGLARKILEEEIPKSAGDVDHLLVGRLERQLRRAGAEDLVIVLSNGDAPPAPAKGARVGENYSVSLSVEYRGHWVRLSRPHVSAEVLQDCMRRFVSTLEKARGRRPRLQSDETNTVGASLENLSGSYPYESISRSDLRPGCIFAMHLEVNNGGKRLFYGDTCYYGASGPEVL